MTNRKFTENLITGAARIDIVSGEGEIGTVERFVGARTIRALKARLTRARCGGDRWARAEIDGQEICF